MLIGKGLSAERVPEVGVSKCNRLELHPELRWKYFVQLAECGSKFRRTRDNIGKAMQYLDSLQSPPEFVVQACSRRCSRDKLGESLARRKCLGTGSPGHRKCGEDVSQWPFRTREREDNSRSSVTHDRNMRSDRRALQIRVVEWRLLPNPIEFLAMTRNDPDSARALRVSVPERGGDSVDGDDERWRVGRPSTE